MNGNGGFYVGKERVWGTTADPSVEEVVLNLLIKRCFVSDPECHGWLIYDKSNGHGIGVIVGFLRPQREAFTRYRLLIDVTEVDPKFHPLLLTYGPEGVRWNGHAIVANGH